jgi:putative phosphoribosyl transferase
LVVISIYNKNNIMLIVSVLFQDRKQAGEELANKLKEYLTYSEDKDFEKLKEWNSKESLIVVAIPRGGVVIGDIIASELHCNLDIVISRKIGAQSNKELAIGAVMPGGSYFLNQWIVDVLKISDSYIQNEVENQKKEIERRLKEFRGNTSYYDTLKGKIVILVDDGIATGATIIAAAQWIKEENKYNCKKLIVAVPVAPANEDTVIRLNQIADKVIILYMPKEFSAVGQFYKQFDQVSDKDVKSIMNKYDSRQP